MRLRLLLLSGTTTTATGVDLDTHGLRRIQWREDAPVFAPYDVVEAQGLPSDDLPFPSDMTWAVDPVLMGRLRGRKAEKLVRPLVHRGTGPFLGAATPSVTYWTLGDTAPSVSLVDPAAGPVVERDRNHHLRCRFRAG
ncbi:MAG TPA: hypothetical protein VM143_11965, partial [Acidimicrobiales bacterium]|nr:hypothetical protein [Acidimicrobiales bacterium]